MLPVIMSIPDIGQLLVRCPEYPELTGSIEGNRKEKWITAVFKIPLSSEYKTIHLSFTPHVLPIPSGFQDEARWEAVRRGWFNLIQLSCGASGGSLRVKGVWANNTLSDPVSSLLYILSDAACLIPELASGVSTVEILRRAVEYWMYDKINEKGLIAYTAKGTPYNEKNRLDKKKNNRQNLMDTNPSVLIGAYCYVRLSGDIEWLTKHIKHLEFISSYMESRDVDNDGLIESVQSGNRYSQPPKDPDCAFDCFCSGHKNAYINALAYRAWLGLAELERLLGRTDMVRKYLCLARNIKLVYLSTFYNKKTGWLGFWKSEDNELHDIFTDIPTSIAIDYGIVDVETGRKMLTCFWNELKRTGFNRFDLGIPLNLRPVPEYEMCYYTPFKSFLNGVCAVSNTAFF